MHVGKSYADSAAPGESSVATTTYPLGGRTFTRTFDEAGRLWQIDNLTSGTGVMTYSYDELNRTVGAIVGASSSPVMAATIGFDARGRENVRTFADGATTLFDQQTTHDPNGNVETDIPTGLAAQDPSRDYEHDALNRIVGQDDGMDSVEDTFWQYDAEGNWLATDQNGSSETRTVNDENEYAQIDRTGDPSWSPSYDPNGNLTSVISVSSVVHYSHDWANRLVEVQDNSTVIAAYTYDAANRRVTKDDQTTLTLYLYDDAQVLQEIEDGVLARSFVYGIYIDAPILMVDEALATPANRWYILDRRSSVVALVDDTGTVQESYSYTPFGLMTIYDASGQEIGNQQSAIGNPYGFTGRRYDPETGLWYYRNRIYSAQLGRFLTRDPLGFVDGWNTYAYVVNNPLFYVDPSGLGRSPAQIAQYLLTSPVSAYGMGRTVGATHQAIVLGAVDATHDVDWLNDFAVANAISWGYMGDREDQTGLWLDMGMAASESAYVGLDHFTLGLTPMHDYSLELQMKAASMDHGDFLTDFGYASMKAGASSLQIVLAHGLGLLPDPASGNGLSIKNALVGTLSGASVGGGVTYVVSGGDLDATKVATFKAASAGLLVGLGTPELGIGELSLGHVLLNGGQLSFAASTVSETTGQLLESAYVDGLDLWDSLGSLDASEQQLAGGVGYASGVLSTYFSSALHWARQSNGWTTQALTKHRDALVREAVIMAEINGASQAEVSVFTGLIREAIDGGLALVEETTKNETLIVNTVTNVVIPAIGDLIKLFSGQSRSAQSGQAMSGGQAAPFMVPALRPNRVRRSPAAIAVPTGSNGPSRNVLFR